VLLREKKAQTREREQVREKEKERNNIFFNILIVVCV
jgi:hypothetical protein